MLMYKGFNNFKRKTILKWVDLLLILVKKVLFNKKSSTRILLPITPPPPKIFVTPEK